MKKNSRLSPLLLAMVMMISVLVQSANAESQARFKHIPLQYIVALGDPGANSGNDAALWGLWRQDPGPRGCRLENYKQLKATGVALAQWPFDRQDWWLEEHGSIMEKPKFPLQPGKYVVTGGREVTSVLTVYPMDQNGEERWELDNGAKLYDVTHLPCHAARYTPENRDNSCTPTMAQRTVFPVAPGVPMPSIKGCNKQEYAVLFVTGVAVQ